MKRLILIALLTLWGTVWAQDVVRDSAAVAADTVEVDDNDTIDDEENVIGAKRQTKGVKKEANVLGAPVYYETNGSVRGSGKTSEAYRRPEHHYYNNLSRRYCSFFVEGTLITGRHDIGLGGNFTYLPKRWGFYATANAGKRHTYLSGGAALRLSGYDSSLDWQLYFGVGGGGRHLGGEAGVRVALPKRNGKFCWSSASLGYANYGGNGYLIGGLSLDLVGIMALSTILFW